MNKIITLLIVLLLFFSCKKSNFENELRGNTYNLISKEEKDTLIIEFKDSICIAYMYEKEALSWKVEKLKNNDFLILGDKIIAITGESKNGYKGLFMGKRNHEILIEKRETKFNRELLKGIWVEEAHYDLFLNDSIIKPLPPPPPLEALESEFQYPPFYEIKEDSIFSNYHYKISKSYINVSNSSELIAMKLRNNYKDTELLWKIKILNDSVMLIDRTVDKRDKKFSVVRTVENNIKLIKKRE
ncbi:hypothetical protein [Pontimicrobium sp. MEBiC01747]